MDYDIKNLASALGTFDYDNAQLALKVLTSKYKLVNPESTRFIHSVMELLYPKSRHKILH